MVQVPGWSDDELEARAHGLAKLVRRVWRGIARSLAASFGGATTTFTVAGGTHLSQAWNAAVQEQVLAYVGRTYLDAAGNVAEAVGLTEYDQAVGEDLAAAHLAAAGNRLYGIGEDVWRVVKQQVALGNRTGESVKEIAARIRNVTGVSDARSLTIARTEVHAAHEAGAYAQALYVDPGGTKRWLATNDDRTRETHRAAEQAGPVVVGKPFQVGKTLLRYPGDPLGDPDETISCRCSVAYEFGDIISPMDPDDAELDQLTAVVAAGKWVAHEHPRGKDGKFIKKGALQELLSAKTVTVKHALDVADQLTAEDWQKLTPTQQDYVKESLGKLPSSSAAGQHAAAKLAAVGAQAGGSPEVKTPDVGKPTVPAGLKGKPGDPVKITTGVIWGKHPPDTTVVEADAGGDRLVWDGKQYLEQTRDADGTYKTQATYTKKDAYATFKKDTHWVVPGVSAPAAQPDTVGEGDVDLDVPSPATEDEIESAFGTPDPFAKFTELSELVEAANTGDVSFTTEQMSLKAAHDYVVKAKSSHPDGTVIAMSNSGAFRIRKIGPGYVREFKLHGQDWQVAEPVLDIDVIQRVRSDAWGVPVSAYEQFAGKSVDAPPPTNAPSYTSQDVITNWPGVAGLGKTYGDGEVVALSNDGAYRLEGNGTDTSFNLVGAYTDSLINTYSSTFVKTGGLEYVTPGWHVPPKSKLPNVAEVAADVEVTKPPDAGVAMTAPDIFKIGIAADIKGVTVAIGKLASPQPGADVTYRLVTAKSFTGADVLDMQIKNNAGGWSSLGSYKTPQEFNTDWGDTINLWLYKPPPGQVDVPANDAPSPVAPTAVPTAPAATAVPAGGDIADIPHEDKTDFKNTFKAAGVGYWSKPEKIWDTIKAIQKKHVADGGDPNQSKYTPLQILNVLDSFYTGKEPNPHATKMTKWAASAKGQAYVKTTPAAQATATSSPSAQPAAPIPEPAPVAGLPNHPTVDTNVNVSYTLKNNPKISNEDIFVKLPDAAPGQVLAYGKQDYGNQKYRLIVTVDENGQNRVTQQYYSPGGTWFGSKKYTGVAEMTSLTKWHVPNGTWVTAENAKVVAPKKAAKSVAPAAPSAPVEPAAGQLNVGGGDISHLPDAKKQSLYQTFKKQPATYLDSPPTDIYAALKTIADDEGLDLLQMIHVIDEVGAKKVGVENKHLFEKKIKDWLKTPQGAAVASGKPIPTPSAPAFTAGVDPNAQLPSFEASSQYKYDVLPAHQATAAWQQMVNKHGTAWTASQRSALRTYTGGAYYSMNAYLYGKLDSVSATHAKSISQAQLGMRPSDRPLLLHRGVNFNGIASSTGHADLEKKVGTTWKSGGFFSTSVGGKAAFASHPVSLEVEAPPGTPMAWLDPISQYKGENEMLLAAGLHYRIVSVKKVGTKTVVRLRVVPAPKEQP